MCADDRSRASNPVSSLWCLVPPLRSYSMRNAIIRVRCDDRTGIIAALSDFVFRHGGNILDLDQHTEPESGVFFMRLVWSLDGFNLDEDGTRMGLEVFARSLGLHWELDRDNRRDRVALFC